MSVRSFTYTIPADIEGEPEEVAEVARKQVKSLAPLVAELAATTFVQLRAAGIDPENPDAVKEWLDSDDGSAASDLVWAAQVFVQVTQAL